MTFCRNDASERASFSQLLLATLNATSRVDAERSLREAQAKSPLRFAEICAEELGDSSRPACSRQLAGILLAASYTKDGALAKELGVSSRTALHAALERAVQCDERMVWSAAAGAIARVASFDVPLGLWPGLIPSLQRGVTQCSACDGSVVFSMEGSITVIKCLAQEWSFDRLVPGLIRIAAQCMDNAYSSSTRVLAAEAVLQILESSPYCIEDAMPQCPDEVARAVLNGCQAEDCQELQRASFLCLEYLCSQFNCLNSYWKQVFVVSLRALGFAPSPVKVVVMEMWTSAVINQFPISNVAAELTQTALEATCNEHAQENSASVLFSARNFLASVCAAAPNSNGMAFLVSFAGAHFQSADKKFRNAALVSIGAVVPHLGEQGTQLIGLSAAQMLEAMRDMTTCAASCWAVGRSLEFKPQAVPHESKHVLFAMCLQGLAHDNYAEDFSYVLSELLKSLTVTPDQFCVMSNQLVQSVEKSTCQDCGLFFNALAVLMKRTQAEHAQDFCSIFGQLALKLISVAHQLQAAEDSKGRANSAERIAQIGTPLERRICWDGSECTFTEFEEYYKTTAQRCWLMSPVAGRAAIVPGVSKCLRALTDQLGDLIGHVAEPLMAYYISDLQVTCAQGGGLDEDALDGIGALACQLGPNFMQLAKRDSALWPLLLHGVGEPPATSSDLATWEFLGPCKSSMLALSEILGAVGRDFVQTGYVSHARDNLLRLLDLPRLHFELRNLGLRLLGRLIFAVGEAVESFHRAFDVVDRPIAHLITASCTDSPCSRDKSTTLAADKVQNLRKAVLASYSDICLGLRNSNSLEMLKPRVPDLLTLVANSTRNESQESLMTAFDFIRAIMLCFPDDVDTREQCGRIHQALMSTLASALTDATSSGVPFVGTADADLAQLLNKCTLKYS